MKKYMFLTVIVLGFLVCISTEKLNAMEQETIMCPGKGERCYQVEFLGVGLWWKKKEKGGPGIIIREVQE
jgi:hypothetical protein